MRLLPKPMVAAAFLAILAALPLRAQEPVAAMQLAAGFEAEVTDSVRADGMLLVSIRFVPVDARNSLTVYNNLEAVFEDGIYVTAGGNRYLLLSDSTGVPLAPQALTLNARQGANWFGQFPAPDEGVTHYSLTLPQGIFFPRVAINDE